MKNHAEAVYGDTTKNPEETSAASVHPDKERAERIYRKPQSSLPTWLRPTIESLQPEAFALDVVDELDAAASSAIEIAQATNEGIARNVVSRYLDAQHRIARTGPNEADDAAREQRLRADTIEARRLLINRYGKEDGPKMLARTQKFVRDTPALAKLLREHGLGSDPAIVEQLAAHVFSNGLGF